MPTHDATALADITFARSTTDGRAIVFGFKDHQDREHKFACPPAAIPIIVARLVAAHTEAANYVQKKPLAIEARKSEIGIDEEMKRVTLGLYPTDHLVLGFSLEPEHAQKISSDLAHAVAILRPRGPKNTN